MATWQEFEQQAPELAARVRAAFDAHVHKTMATLRKDGSPRISGTEVRFAEGELWLGSMPGALKARDLLRDPRVALHSGSAVPDESDPGSWPGDAKVAGRALEVRDPEVHSRLLPGPEFADSHLFRVDLTEAVTVRVDMAREGLVIDSWHEGRGVKSVFRK